MRKIIAGIAAALAAVAGLIVLLSAVVITRADAYTVIREFGRVVKVIDAPGLSFRVPFVQTADTLPKNVLLYDLPVSEVITEDKKTMAADSFVLWRIADPQTFIQTLSGSVPNAEARIEALTYNALKNVISAQTQEQVISGRDGQLAARITETVVSGIQPYGIEVIAVETKRLDLPDENKSSVYSRMISERESIAAGILAEGESEGQKIRSETDKQVEILISQAEADAERLRAEGEAEYMRILSEAYSDPDRADFYQFVRALDAAKAGLAGGDKTLILDKDSPLAAIFYELDDGAPPAAAP